MFAIEEFIFLFAAGAFYFALLFVHNIRKPKTE